MKVKRSVMRFQDRVFPWCMQKSLFELREAVSSCDVVLVMNNKEWRVHKTVLSAASPYFCAMFNSKFREAGTNRITLHDVDSDSLTAILDFIYSAQVNLNPDNVFQLMDASNYLQVISIKTWISNYLLANLVSENCVGLYERAVTLNYHDLARESLIYIRKHFPRVVEQDEFLQASGELLTTLLASKFLKVPSENYLIKVIMKWINADAEQRSRYVIDLLNNLDLRNIQLHKLTNLRNEAIFMEDNDLGDFLEAKIAEWGATAPAEPSEKWKTVRYAAEQEVILVLGGEIEDTPTRSMECFTFGYESWERFVPQYVSSRKGPRNLIPLAGMNFARTNAAVAYDAYNVYVLGGRSSISFLNECEYYSIKTNTWTKITQLPVMLEGGSAVIFENRLTFIGGLGQNGFSDAVWQWEESSGTWKSLAPLTTARAFHCSISFGGYIYTMGGFAADDKRALKSVERYDPIQKKWSEIQTMNRGRGKFACALVNNCIYVMGGTDKGSTLRSIEKYIPETNTWSYLAPMPTPRSEFAVVVYKKKIFCMGGTNNLHNLRSIDKYSTTSNRWHYLFSLQSFRCGLAAAVLNVPYITRDV